MRPISSPRHAQQHTSQTHTSQNLPFGAPQAPSVLRAATGKYSGPPQRQFTAHRCLLSSTSFVNTRTCCHSATRQSARPATNDQYTILVASWLPHASFDASGPTSNAYDRDAHTQQKWIPSVAWYVARQRCTLKSVVTPCCRRAPVAQCSHRITATRTPQH